MAEFYNGKMEKTNENSAEYALISINEYNGLRKVLRLYYDLKENKNGHKSENESRYKVLDQQITKEINNWHNFMSWSTTLVTPYYSDLNYEEVSGIVRSDLERYLGLLGTKFDVMECRDIEDEAVEAVMQLNAGKLGKDEYGIFYAALRYNGRNENWEVKLRSVKRIPIDIFVDIREEH